MYLRAAKTSAEEAGIETDGMAKSVSKLRENILKLADVDIMFDDENFKSTYEILDEISKKWDEISDIDRSNLLNLMGGKRNANVLASIIENFDEARAAVEAAEDSAGSATKENEKWLESIQGHLNQLKVTFEEFSQRIMESDFIKGAIDFLAGIVKALDQITEAFGGLTPIVLSLLGNSFFNHNKWGFGTALVDGHRQLTLFGRTMGEINTTFNKFQSNTNAASGSAKKFFSTIGNGARAVGTAFTGRLSERFGFITKEQMNANIKIAEDYYAKLQDVGHSKKAVNKAYRIWLGGDGKEASKEIRNVAQEMGKLHAKGQDASKALDNFRASQAAVREGSSLLRNVLSGLSGMFLNLGMTLAINFAIQGIAKVINTVKEQEEQARKAAESFQEIYGNANKEIEKIRLLRNELDDNNTTELRATAIKKELVEIQNQLAETYGDTAKNVNLATTNLDDYISKLREVNAQKYNEVDYYKNSSGTNSVIDKFNNVSVQLDRRAYMGDYGLFSNYYGEVVNELKKIWDDVAKDIGANGPFGLSNAAGDIELGGDVFTVDKELLEVQKRLEEFINNDKLAESVRDNYQQVFNYIGSVRRDFIDETLKDKATFEAYIINGSNYSDIYYDLIREQSNYNYKISKAETEEEARQIRQEYQDALDKAFAGIDEEKDPAVLQWFKSEFEIPESEISTTKEKIKSKYALLYEELQSSLDELKSLYEGAFSGRSTIQSAYDKIISGTALTSDEVLKLVDTCKEAFPEISTVFEKTANGYTANASDLIRANEAIQKSAEKALRETMQKYQSIVEAYESRATTIPVNDWTKGGTPGIEVSRTDIGIDEEAYKDAKNKIEEYRLILSMLGVSLDDTSKKGTELGNVLKTLSSEISIGAKAEKEMVENGTLAAATIESITSLGEEYWKCLTVENGQIKLNVDAYKELTKAKLADEIATLRLAKAEVERLFPSEYSTYHHLTDETKALYDDIKNKLAIAESSYDNFDNEWNANLTSGSSTKDDAESERNKLYEKRYKELERFNNGTLASEKKFVDDWIALNEEIYKSTDPDKYKENLEKIVDYIVNADSRIKSHLDEWSRDNNYNENDTSSRVAYYTEWSNAVSVLDKELKTVIDDLAEMEGLAEDPERLAVYQKLVDEYNNRQLELAKYEAETIKKKYDNGEYQGYSDYQNDIYALGKKYTAADGGNLLDGTFFSDYVNAKDQFENWLEEENKMYSDSINSRKLLLSKEHDELLKHRDGTDGHIKFSAKEFENYYTQYANDYVDYLKQEVEKGIITNEQAQKELHDIFHQAGEDGVDIGGAWLTNNLLDFDSYEEELERLERINDGSIESEKEYIQKWKDLNYSTYGDKHSPFYDLSKYEANIKSIADYELSELQKAFEQGKLSAEEYADAVANALKEKDILGAEYVSDALKEADKIQAEQEKSYWEDQKQRVSDYYDMELQKLQDIKDEKEQIAKAEELQLNLIKARVELEKAKSQRNQLIFQNGSFFYDVDQEAVMDKANAVAEAEDAIVAQKLDDEIQLLTEQKDAALEYYSDIIEMIEAYIGETKSITESNPEIFNKIVNSEYSQEIKKRQKGELKPNELTDEQLNATGTDDKTKANADAAVTKAATEEHKSDEERKKEWKEYITQPITNLFSEVINLVKLSGVSLTSSLLFGSNSPAQDQTAAGLGNIQSAASINNDNSVNVGDITMHIQGGTSEEMLKQFASKLSAAISAALPRATVKQ